MGQATSAADDLDYMHARFYNPQLGRFLGTDPANSAQAERPQTWNKYVYSLSNPILYVDPDGRIIETAWDAANVAIGATSLIANVVAGNYPGAILDIGGLVLDLGATVTPVVPGGASSAIKAARLAENARFGKAFETAVLSAVGFSKNTEHITSASGAKRYRIPDGLDKEAGILLELKGVANLKLTDQVKDFLASAKDNKQKVVIVVKKNTKVSKQYKDYIANGDVILVRADT